MPNRAIPRWLLLSLALLGALPCAVAYGAPPSVQIDTDVREKYYDVFGTTADEIFTSIEGRRLGSEAGLSASGLTESELSFRLSTTTSDGACRLDAIALTAVVHVTLPRHARPSSMDAKTRRQWSAYEALVEFHEYRHVEIEFRGVEELEAKFRGDSISAPGSADSCNAYVERAIQEQAAITRSRHEQFHVEETASVRRAQSALLEEMSTLDSGLGHQKAEIDRLAEDLATVDGERSTLGRRLEELMHRFGNALPHPEYEQAQEIAAAIEDRTAEMNGLVNSRNALIENYNLGIEDRRELAERLAWTR